MPAARPTGKAAIKIAISISAIMLVAAGVVVRTATAASPAATSSAPAARLADVAVQAAPLAPAVSTAPTETPPASPTPTAAPTPTPAASPPAAFGPGGRLAIPALRVSGAIRDLPECGGLLPDTGIWAWPCGGPGNLTLLAHAYGSFAPIYRGYHSGALRVGLSATYTDSSGTGHAYHVAEIWGLTDTDALSGWAFSGWQSPVITLVTCDDGDRRVVVRLIPDGTTDIGPVLPSAPPTP